jgi:hypothetical protein
VHLSSRVVLRLGDRIRARGRLTAFTVTSRSSSKVAAARPGLRRPGQLRRRRAGTDGSPDRREHCVEVQVLPLVAASSRRYPKRVRKLQSRRFRHSS